MRVQLLALALGVAAYAAPVDPLTTRGEAGNHVAEEWEEDHDTRDVAEPNVEVLKGWLENVRGDVARVHELGQAEGLQERDAGLGDAVDAVGGLVNNLTSQLVPALHSVDATLSTTVGNLFTKLDNNLNHLSAVADKGKSATVLNTLLAIVESLVAQIEYLLTGSMMQVDPAFAADIQQQFLAINSAVENIHTQTESDNESWKRSVATGPVKNPRYANDLAELIHTVAQVVKQVNILLRSTFSHLDGGIAHSISELLTQITNLANKVERVLDGVISATDAKGLLGQVNTLLSEVEDLVGKFLGASGNIHALVAELMATIAQIEAEVDGTLQCDNGVCDTSDELPDYSAAGGPPDEPGAAPTEVPGADSPSDPSAPSDGGQDSNATSIY